MKLFFSIVSVTLCLLVASATYAQVLPDYRCTVDCIISASLQSKNVRRNQKAQFIGRQFTVERRTDVMAGVLKNLYMTQPIVVDTGSVENAFKVVTTMRRDQGAGVDSMI